VKNRRGRSNAIGEKSEQEVGSLNDRRISVKKHRFERQRDGRSIRLQRMIAFRENKNEKIKENGWTQKKLCLGPGRRPNPLKEYAETQRKLTGREGCHDPNYG